MSRDVVASTRFLEQCPPELHPLLIGEFVELAGKPKEHHRGDPGPQDVARHPPKGVEVDIAVLEEGHGENRADASNRHGC